MSGSADPFSILNKNPNRGLWAVKPKVEPTQILRKGVKPKDAYSSDEDFDIFSDEDKKAKKQSQLKNPPAQTATAQPKNENAKMPAQELNVPAKKQLFSMEYLRHEKPNATLKKVTTGEVENSIEAIIQQKKAEFQIEERSRGHQASHQADRLEHREGEIIAGIEEADEESFDAVEEDIDGFEDDQLNANKSEQENATVNNFDEDVFNTKDNFRSDDKAEMGEELVKIVYIPKNLRLRDAEKPSSDPRKAKLAKMRRANSALIKLTKALHAESENLANVSEESIIEMISDDDDQATQQEEYKAWKIRELQRIKRDELERHKTQMLKEETARRAQMNDLERMAEDKAIGKYDRPEKSDYRYMQKYYSSFAFYQDSNDPIFQRDFNVAVGYDNFDKSVLPERMQRRGDDFGKKGKSKYRDLLTEDTNNYQAIWAPNQAIADRLKQKQAGYRSFNNTKK